MTCKQLVTELHQYIWTIFWLSISVHIFLGVFIPLMRDFVTTLKSVSKRNFQEPENFGKTNRNQADN